jgi:hypothetical protein
MRSWSYMQVVMLRKQAPRVIFGASNGCCRRNVKPTVTIPQISYDKLVLTANIGVKVFGFLTVPADAKCGVCAHEIGHLGMVVTILYQ